ncbi:MAG: DUF934 domain-containing protein [Alphaproteobacteria bacterium]
MPLIKNGALADDPWTTVDDAEPLPPGPVILSLRRFQAERERLRGLGVPLGLRLGNAEPVAVLVPDLDAVRLVALEFPSLADGRAFSQARLLRERHGFRGELRATGAVLRDQVFFMKRCGFDSFVLPADRDPGEAIAALTEFSVAYQPAADSLHRPFRT